MMISDLSKITINLFPLVIITIGSTNTVATQQQQQLYKPGNYTPYFLESLKAQNSWNDALNEDFNNAPDIGATLLYGDSEIEYDENGGISINSLKQKKNELISELKTFLTPVKIGWKITPVYRWVMKDGLKGTKFTAPEQILPFSYNFMDEMKMKWHTQDRAKIKNIQNSFRDSNIAENSFFESITQSAFKLHWLLRHRSTANNDEKVKIQTILHEARLNYNENDDYYFLNTEMLGQIAPRIDPDHLLSDRYPVGAFTLLKHNKISKKLIPVGVRVSMDDNGNTLESIYTKANSSPSAWRLALLAAKCSLTQWGITVGHWSGSHGPWVFLNEDAEYNPNRFFPLLKIYSQTYARDNFTTLRPSQYYIAHGIKQDLIDDLGDVGMNKENGFEKIAKTFARKLVNKVYNNNNNNNNNNTNSDVENDLQLQAMLTHATRLGNLGDLVIGKQKIDN
eukprot:Pgem_evm1s1552